MFTQKVVDTFWQAIGVTGKGMLGIFIFMLIFFLIIQLIDRLFPKELRDEPITMPRSDE